MKTLEGLKWKPKWVTHLGCLKGCLDYLKVEVSDAWLFGASGYAFVINIHEVICPSGPTAWKTQRMVELCQNVGCKIDEMFAHKSQKDFADKQRLAWERVRRGINEGLPCYGWELDIPEFYVIHGYDDVGYYFNGPMCDAGKGPKRWQELGDTGIGCLEVFIVRRCEPAGAEETVKQALQFAIEWGKSPDKYIFPKYAAGLAGYALWIDALKNNKADGFGTAYNAVVWAECRRYAVEFLREAKGKMSAELSPRFDEAIAHYEVVSKNLAAVSDTFPFLKVSDEQKKANITDPKRRQAAIEALQHARDAEEKGLSVFEQILSRR